MRSQQEDRTNVLVVMKIAGSIVALVEESLIASFQISVRGLGGLPREGGRGVELTCASLVRSSLQPTTAQQSSARTDLVCSVLL